MKQKVSGPAAAIIIVVAVAVVGMFLFKGLSGSGSKITPEDTKNQMSKMKDEMMKQQAMSGRGQGRPGGPGGMGGSGTPPPGAYNNGR